MKVVHLPGSLSRKGGGVFQVALEHSLYLSKNKTYDIEVIGTQDESTLSDIQEWKDVKTTALTLSKSQLIKIDRLKDSILELQPSILHSHMLWTAQSRVLSQLNSSHNIPYIVSTHGMLDKWTLNLKKKIALVAFEKKSLNNAACIHALNYNEYLAIRSLGIKSPVAIIPNGVHLKAAQKVNSKGGNKKTMLFLSRIDPKKGLEELLQAISYIKNEFASHYNLHLYGWGEARYIQKIESLILKYGLAEIVSFKGAVFGKEKQEVYNQCDVFILPSHSEGLPMVVLEAWNSSKPVIMTNHCNIPEGFDQGAAFMIDSKPTEMAKQLSAFLQIDNQQLHLMGERGHVLVESSFNWEKIGSQLRELYDWILKNKTKPDFVMLN